MSQFHYFHHHLGIYLSLLKIKIAIHLQKFLLNYKSDIIKEIFVFDFFYNEQKEEIKIGFRFVFQSKISTITDTQVNMIMDEIINETSSMESVTIPGLINLSS